MPAQAEAVWKGAQGPMLQPSGEGSLGLVMADLCVTRSISSRYVVLVSLQLAIGSASFPRWVCKGKMDRITYTANIYHRNVFVILPFPLLLLDLLTGQTFLHALAPRSLCVAGETEQGECVTANPGDGHGHRAPAPALQAGKPRPDLGSPCHPFLKLRERFSV